MEKKISPKKEDSASVKRSGLTGKIFAVVKFLLGMCLLPFVYSVTVAFLREFSVIEAPFQNYFWAGLVSFLIIYAFIWEPQIVYARGQKLLELTFGFFKPLIKVAPYLLPIYTIVLFLAYLILSLTFKSLDLVKYFFFLFGFTICLHLVFSAKSLRSKQGEFLRVSYVFGFSVIYILNLVLLAILIKLIFDGFSLTNFFVDFIRVADNILYAVFKQLF
ncbi:MAG: hypothetical protein V1674_06715 [Candidatus Omnitrophota bacterium]